MRLCWWQWVGNGANVGPKHPALTNGHAPRFLAPLLEVLGCFLGCRRPDLNWRHRAYEACCLIRFVASFLPFRDGFGSAGGNALSTISTAACSSARPMCA